MKASRSLNMQPTSLFSLVLLAASVKAILGPENSVQFIVSRVEGLRPAGPAPPETYYTTGSMLCGGGAKHTNTAVHSVIVSNDTTRHAFTDPQSARKATALWYTSLERDPITDASYYRINCREPDTKSLRILALYNTTAGTPLITQEVSPTANRTEDRHLRYLWNITQVEQEADGRFGLPVHYYLFGLVTPAGQPLYATLGPDNMTVTLEPLTMPFPDRQVWVFAPQPYSAEGDPEKTAMEAESDLAASRQEDVMEESEIPKEG
ncbi:hypothetical protein C8R43DRAFT_1180351 [Mycena crocata]|nr:hypothetical protein C8R43DRAFT_1180351 [Mycena crocata]